MNNIIKTFASISQEYDKLKKEVEGLRTLLALNHGVPSIDSVSQSSTTTARSKVTP